MLSWEQKRCFRDLVCQMLLGTTFGSGVLWARSFRSCCAADEGAPRPGVVGGVTVSGVEVLRLAAHLVMGRSRGGVRVGAGDVFWRGCGVLHMRHVLVVHSQDGGASLAAAVSSCSSCLCNGGRGGGLDVMVSSCSGIEVS